MFIALLWVFSRCKMQKSVGKCALRDFIATLKMVDFGKSRPTPFPTLPTLDITPCTLKLHCQANLLIANIFVLTRKRINPTKSSAKVPWTQQSCFIIFQLISILMSYFVIDNVFVKVQKVNGWKATLGGVHLQKIENQVRKLVFSSKIGKPAGGVGVYC